MKIIYANEKLKLRCTSLGEAQKFFGGEKSLAVKLLARINALESASVLKDIIMTPPMRFHALTGDKAGLFAIDMKTRRDPWRIILQPLDEEENPYSPCRIDEIANVVKIIEIEELSKHYE